MYILTTKLIQFCFLKTAKFGFLRIWVPRNKKTCSVSLLQVKLQPDSYFVVKGKGKAVPLQAWTGPEGSRRLRCPDFKTFGT